ncbi:hypothetical protein B0H13DRAFT_2044276 [Mycena leptocephala]|nr:hypothetical protein B0H13DRAFT_2044276 [Mycena leptocephala]
MLSGGGGGGGGDVERARPPPMGTACIPGCDCDAGGVGGGTVGGGGVRTVGDVCPCMKKPALPGGVVRDGLAGLPLAVLPLPVLVCPLEGLLPALAAECRFWCDECARTVTSGGGGGGGTKVLIPVPVAPPPKGVFADTPTFVVSPSLPFLTGSSDPVPVADKGPDADTLLACPCRFAGARVRTVTSGGGGPRDICEGGSGTPDILGACNGACIPDCNCNDDVLEPNADEADEDDGGGGGVGGTEDVLVEGAREWLGV